MARYPDPFRNALMTSHELYVRGELWAVGASKALPVLFANGSVSADRNANVRRTAQLTVDPNLAPSKVTDALTPYGSIIKLFRGLRYVDGTSEEYAIFYGRVEAIDDSLDGLTVRCSDRAADIVDARFGEQGRYAAYTPPPPGVLCRDFAKTLITEVLPTAVVHIATTSPATTTRAMFWERERGDALNDLCTAMGAEWSADSAGEFWLAPLPAAIDDTTQPVWIVDSGDSGVVISRNHTMDRQGVFNEIFVTGEAIGGDHGAPGYWRDDPAPPYNGDPNSPTRWGGPFGKVPGFYTGQAARSTDEANAVARRIGLQAISKTRSIQVTCVVNPMLRLGDVILVAGVTEGVNGMYYVQSMDIPLEPESPMSMVLSQSLGADASHSEFGYRPAAIRIPEGWQWP